VLAGFDADIGCIMTVRFLYVFACFCPFSDARRHIEDAFSAWSTGAGKGTITARPRKGSGVGYTAQIRIKREGKVVYQESQAFDRKQTAQTWIKRRETELAEPGARARVNDKAVSIKGIIDQHLDEYERIRPLSETTRATLTAAASTW